LLNVQVTNLSVVWDESRAPERSVLEWYMSTGAQAFAREYAKVVGCIHKGGRVWEDYQNLIRLRAQLQ